MTHQGECLGLFIVHYSDFEDHYSPMEEVLVDIVKVTYPPASLRFVSFMGRWHGLKKKKDQQ